MREDDLSCPAETAADTSDGLCVLLHGGCFVRRGGIGREQRHLLVAQNRDYRLVCRCDIDEVLNADLVHRSKPDRTPSAWGEWRPRDQEIRLLRRGSYGETTRGHQHGAMCLFLSIFHCLRLAAPLFWIAGFSHRTIVAPILRVDGV